MATPAQITANRANAQKSTGPRSPEGKSASRFNALKHGMDAASIVIPGEDPAEYERLHKSYLREYQPRCPSEHFHVDAMLRANWLKRRLESVEADLYQTVLAEAPDLSLADALLAESPAAKLLARIERQIAAFDRTWHRANNELRRARKAAATAEDQAFDTYLDRITAKPAPGELASFLQSRKPAAAQAQQAAATQVQPAPTTQVEQATACQAERCADSKPWLPIDEKSGRSSIGNSRP